MSHRRFRASLILAAVTLALAAPRLVAEEPAKAPAPAQPPAAAEAQPATVFLTLGKEPKTVELLLVAAFNEANGGMNFNGQIKGAAAITVPVGWAVNVTFKNGSAVPHSAMFVDLDEVREIRPKGPAFKGASTPNPEVGVGNTETQKFSFTASAEGKYAVVCAFPAHALAGHWIKFTVAPETAKPSYDVGAQHTEAK